MFRGSEIAGFTRERDHEGTKGTRWQADPGTREGMRATVFTKDDSHVPTLQAPVRLNRKRATTLNNNENNNKCLSQSIPPIKLSYF